MSPAAKATISSLTPLLAAGMVRPACRTASPHWRAARPWLPSHRSITGILYKRIRLKARRAGDMLARG